MPAAGPQIFSTQATSAACNIAPKSKLCFATAFTGEVQFAANILKLADPKGRCKANVIDDDVGYSQEPVFSDGVVALAVDQVKADGGTSGLTWYLAIALRPGGAAQHAMHLSMIDFDDGNQVTLLKFANRLAPSVFGHPAAAGAIAVAADFWDNTLSTEYFSSLGPTTIYLDQDNLPLAKPELRKKPEITAPDGVDTTFFGSPGVPGDPHPLFFGTSAAAPHAAAVAALLIQAAGGPGDLSPDQLKTLLEETTQQPHQLIAGAVSATLTGGGDTLKVNVAGFLPLDPSQFRFAFNGDADDSVASIVMNAGSKENISFGDNTDQFLIGNTKLPPADIVYLNNNGLNPVAKLHFLNHAFKSGRFVDLGFDFDNSLIGFGGINAGLLYGTTVTATIQSGNTSSLVSGRLGGPAGRGYAVTDGLGLIDAFAAYLKLTGGAASGQ